MPPQAIDLVGARFGKLLVTERAGTETMHGSRRAAWICKCDCGNTVKLNSKQLNFEKRKSCGCAKRVRVRRTNEFSGEMFTPEELDSAIRMQAEEGMTWKRVAAKLNRKQTTLQAMVYQYQAGTLRFTKVNTRKQTQIIAEEILNGLSVPDACKKYGLIYNTLRSRLALIGLDNETIKEERELRAA